jgi:TolA-binding protein
MRCGGLASLALPALLAVLAPAPASAQQMPGTEEALRRADALAAAGDAEAAVAAYRQWLQAAGEVDGQVLLRAAEAAGEAPEALRLFAEFTPLVRDPAAREACVERQVGLLWLLGRGEDALALQRGLAETPGRLLQRAAMAIELGLMEEAEGVLDRLVAQGGSEGEVTACAYFLLGSLYQATGRPGETTFRLLVRTYPDAPVAPAALLALYESLRQRGEAEEAAQVLQQLASRFPGSPELALARSGGKARYAAVPLRLLPSASEAELPAPVSSSAPPAAEAIAETAITRPAALPASSAAPASAEPEPAGALVQVGSFRDAENARYLVGDLVKRGFEARIVEGRIGEALYYRVVVGPKQRPEAAQATLLRLKDAGFEGVLLLE